MEGNELETPEVVQPVVNHAEKIGHIEERMSTYETRLIDEMARLQGSLAQQIEEGGRGASERISAIEERLAVLAEKLEKAAEPEPEPQGEQVPAGDGTVHVDAVETEDSPAPPEKIKRGVRARRKTRVAAKKQGK